MGELPKVIVSWLRWDDVECVRCNRYAGPEYATCWVVEGVVCPDCITEAEKARAVPQP